MFMLCFISLFSHGFMDGNAVFFAASKYWINRTDIHVAQTLNPNDFDDSLTFHLAPPAVKPTTYQVKYLLGGLAIKSFSDTQRRMNPAFLLPLLLFRAVYPLPVMS